MNQRASDDVYKAIFDALSQALKQSKSADSNKQDPFQIECEFQGTKKYLYFSWPIGYKELLSQIRLCFKRMDLIIFSIDRFSQVLFPIRSQHDLDALITRSNASAQSTNCCLLLIPEHEASKMSSSGGQYNWGRKVGIVDSRDDCESPPPGTLPQAEKLAMAKHSISCPSYNEGMFIPDEEEDVISVGSPFSNSRSSPDSFSSTHSAPGTISSLSMVSGADRIHSATYPKTKSVGDFDQNLLHGSALPYTYPFHKRRPGLPSSGSFGSLTSSNSNSSLRLNDLLKSTWKKGRLLGSGPMGQVYLCYEVESGREMAAKVIEISSNDERVAKEVKDLECEIQLLKSLNHDRIIQYYGSHDEKLILSIFMEYMTGGSVADQIREYGPVNESLLRHYCQQIIEGLIFLHELKIVHRDIKGSNILRDRDGNIKLSDFGTLKRLQVIVSSSKSKSKSSGGRWIGIPHYLAPEVIENGGSNYGRKADIWSFGCTVIEMLTGRPPWHKLSNAEVVSKIVSHSPPFYVLPNAASDSAKSFISLCFYKNKTDRASADRLLTHAFIKDVGAAERSN